MKRGNFKSRKARKQSTRRIYQKSDGLVSAAKNPIFRDFTESLRRTFGFSKHRVARVMRFQARQRGKR